MKLLITLFLAFTACGEEPETWTSRANEAPFNIHLLAEQVWHYYGMWDRAPLPAIGLVTGEALDCPVPGSLDSWKYSVTDTTGTTFSCVSGLTTAPNQIFIGYSGRSIWLTAMAHELWHARMGYVTGDLDAAHASAGYYPAGMVDCANEHLRQGWDADLGPYCRFSERYPDIRPPRTCDGECPAP